MLDQLPSSDERRGQGKALRDRVPRVSHAGWKAPKNRRDPVDVVLESNADRIEQLIPVRMGRMAQSPFAFYRGAAALMAYDLASTPVSGIRVQACGDAHLMNFGGFATPERNIIFDINDFDETLPGPWEWDLKRLAASIVVAAQHVRLSESEAHRLANTAARAYREKMADYSSMRVLDVWYDRIYEGHFMKEAESAAVKQKVRKQMDDTLSEARRKGVPDFLFPKLVHYEGSIPRFKDDPPLLFHPDEKLAPDLEKGMRKVLADYRGTLPAHVRVVFDRFAYCDMAAKVVGVGSVGTRCVVLLFMAAEDDSLILQAKEARASVLEPYVGESLHANHGERVVAGQRLMQSASDMMLGWTVGTDKRDYYIRQLRDMKASFNMEAADYDLLNVYARMCARALARAHARSGDAAMIAGYLGSSTTFDDAIGEFAAEYADQNRKDYRAFTKAIKEGHIEVLLES
ncbi:MAG: DUF2252 domain-containing protein [Burkholderiales bacterium]